MKVLGGISKSLAALPLWAVFWFWASPIPRASAVSFIEVLNYRSAADSPFDLSGLGETFFLEDFENSSRYVTEIHGASVRTQADWHAGGITSVLGPDLGGVALESEGHAMYPTLEIWNFKLTQDSWTGFQFDFHQESLGFPPTAFGFVRSFTETLDADLTIDAYGPDGQLLGSINKVFDVIGEKPFLGVVDSRGISRVVITSHTLTFNSDRRSANLSIDHVQYGLIVPEPSTEFLALIAAVCISSSELSVPTPKPFLLKGNAHVFIHIEAIC